MKNLEVHNYGVAQMTTREMRTTNGGIFGLIAGFMLGLFVMDLIFGDQN